METYRKLLNDLKADLATADLSTIDAVKEFCKQHYNAGLSSIIECWEDSDIQEIIDDKSVKIVLLQQAEEELEMIADADYYSREVVPQNSKSDFVADDSFDWF